MRNLLESREMEDVRICSRMPLVPRFFYEDTRRKIIRISNLAENYLRKWFSEIVSYLIEKGYSTIIKYVDRIYNRRRNNNVVAERGEICLTTIYFQIFY